MKHESAFDIARSRKVVLAAVMGSMFLPRPEAAQAEDFVCDPATQTMQITMPDGNPMTVPCAPGETSPATEQPAEPAPQESAPAESTPETPEPGADEESPSRTSRTRRSSPRPQAESVFSDEWNFKGYEMGASNFTSGNGCYITSTASALRRVTGNEDIKPRTIYNSSAKLRKMWSPSEGVIRGSLYNTLPAIANRYDVRAQTVGFKGARLALQQGGQVLMLAKAGHFTGGGHYMTGRKSLSNGNILIDDGNGKGRKGDSERKRGWGGKELKSKGIIRYIALTRR